MILDCILDTCPQNNKMVDYRDCCKCAYNPLGEIGGLRKDGQPKTGCQECTHLQAKHEPDLKRWHTIKSNVGTAHLFLCGPKRG